MYGLTKNDVELNHMTIYWRSKNEAFIRTTRGAGMLFLNLIVCEEALAFANVP